MALSSLANGVSICLTGKLAESPGREQEKELQVENIQILGECDPKVCSALTFLVSHIGQKYPIQKQALSVEHLRDYVHLRPRTNTIAAMLRLRSALSRNISSYFEDQQAFFNVQSPILTGNDAEGSGETFRIAPVPSSEHDEEFFGLPAHLTVSSQLHLEALATSLSRVYTLSPCFRAERSQTSRHLSEFWMLEAEWVDTEASSPSGVHNVCSFVEDNLRNIVSPLLRSPDLDELWSEHTLQKRISLEDAITSKTPWARMSYTDAIKELGFHHSTRQPFEFTPKWGSSLQSEHERWLAESLIKGPVFITDYPKSLKPFYMRANPTADGSDQTTVACFDLIIPYIGELVGGSVREERAEVLEANLRESGMSVEDYQWYLDLRRYGGFPHLGFGMGFERLVAWVGGIENVRECIAMPRWAGRMGL